MTDALRNLSLWRLFFSYIHVRVTLSSQQAIYPISFPTAFSYPFLLSGGLPLCQNHALLLCYFKLFVDVHAIVMLSVHFLLCYCYRVNSRRVNKLFMRLAAPPLECVVRFPRCHLPLLVSRVSTNLQISLEQYSAWL